MIFDISNLVEWRNKMTKINFLKTSMSPVKQGTFKNCLKPNTRRKPTDVLFDISLYRPTTHVIVTGLYIYGDNNCARTNSSVRI